MSARAEKSLTTQELELLKQGVILVRGEKYSREWAYEFMAAISLALGVEPMSQTEIDAIWDEMLDVQKDIV